MITFDLSNKVALITGGSRGIGRAIARRLAAAGVDVVINYLRHNKEADELVEEVRALGRRAYAVRANVAEEEGLDRIFATIHQEFGRLDIMVSNAASGVLRPALEIQRKHWQWTLDINAGTLIPLIQRAVPLMPQGGKVIAISSLGAVRALPNYSVVGASKAALESLVRHISTEVAPLGINVNVLSAGVVDTDALKHFPNRDWILENSRERTPAGRLTTPEDVADVTLFLCSPLANMIHGQTIIVDGGYSIVA